MNTSDQDRLHELLSAVVDGTVRNDQVEELARMIESDADMRRFYVHYLDMHATLMASAPREAAWRRWRLPWVAAVASFLAASLAVAWFAIPGGQRGGVPEQSEAESVEDASAAGYVGTIASASNDAILNGDRVSAGMRLVVGAYVVADGGVTVQFDGGARVFFTGPSQFVLRSRRSMAIDRGTFVFQGDQTCESIEIATPHSVFKNIGTRYAAVVDSGSEEVHVAEGAVRRTTEDGALPARHELIEAGAGRRYDGEKGRRSKSIPLDTALVASAPKGGSSTAVAMRAVAADDFCGDGDQLHGMRSGQGWAEPWRSPGGQLRLVSPGLAGEGSVAVLHDGSGGDASARRTAAHRQLETPIDLSQDGMWYLRFLVRRGPAKPKDEHRAMVVLRKRGLTVQEELEQNALIQIALRRDDTAMIRVADSLTRVAIPQIPGETYAVVVKIVAGRVKPEQVLVRLMAAERLAGSEEPAEWSVVSDSVHTDLRIDMVSLECVSAGRVEFGDVLIGPTWQSVAAAHVEP